MNKETFIQDWMEGKIKPDEMERLRKEPEYQEVINELEGILNSASRLAPPKTKSKTQVWEDISDKLEESENKPGPKVIPISRYLGIAIAAAVSLILVVYFLLPGTTNLSTTSGEQLSYDLPDGSTVVLNAETSITFNESNWKEERIISLDGEALFDVQAGTPFKVITSAGTIEVLGTSFNAYNRGETLEVSCFEGKVKVISESLKEVVLTPGEKVEVIEMQAEKFDSRKTATWVNGEFYYENTPFGRVIEELERQFNITVEMKTSADRVYEGYFNNKDLNEALQLVVLPMGLEYEKQGSTVIIR